MIRMQSRRWRKRVKAMEELQDTVSKACKNTPTKVKRSHILRINKLPEFNKCELMFAGMYFYENCVKLHNLITYL
jgi:hypothetical protein